MIDMQLSFEHIERFLAWDDFHERYLTSRKHCNKCKRWRLVVDFSVRQWWDDEKTIPQILATWCKNCGHAHQAAALKKNLLNVPEEIANTTNMGRGPVDAKKFVELLNPTWVNVAGSKKALSINGKRLTNSETSALWRWSSGRYKTVMMGTVDKWATKFDIPMWEIEEVAKIAA